MMDDNKHRASPWEAHSSLGVQSFHLGLHCVGIIECVTEAPSKSYCYYHVASPTLNHTVGLSRQTRTLLLGMAFQNFRYWVIYGNLAQKPRAKARSLSGQSKIVHCTHPYESKRGSDQSQEEKNNTQEPRGADFPG